LLSDVWIGKVRFADNVNSVLKDLLELGLEELWLDFSDFIEFNEGVLQHNLIVFRGSCSDYIVHVGNQLDHRFHIFLLHCL